MRTETGPPRPRRMPIPESISDDVFTVDLEWEWGITSFNRAAEEITGTPLFRRMKKPGTSLPKLDCRTRRAKIQ
jgi:hypothetical protein